MENPAYWKEAERIIMDVLARCDENAALPPGKRRIGGSRAAQITQALCKAGLLVEGASMYNSPDEIAG